MSRIAAEASDKRAHFEWMAAPMTMTCIKVRSVDHLARHGESCIKLSISGSTPTGTQVIVPSGATVLNSEQRKQPFAHDWDALWLHGDQACYTTKVACSELDACRRIILCAK